MSVESKEFTARTPSAIAEIEHLEGVLMDHFQPQNNDGIVRVHQSERSVIVDVLGGNNDSRPPKEGSDIRAVTRRSDEFGSWIMQVIKKDYSETGHHYEEFDIIVVNHTGRLMTRHKESERLESRSGVVHSVKNNESVEEIRISTLEEMQAFIGSALHLIGLEPVKE